MGILLYQLTIVVTIVACSMWSKKIGFWSAIAWSFESVIFIFFPPLLLFQLAVIWITYTTINNASEAKSSHGNPSQTVQQPWRLTGKRPDYFGRPKRRKIRQPAQATKTAPSLTEALQDYPSETQSRILTNTATNNIRPISGRDHLTVLRASIAQSNDTLCILSGWVSSSVVNNPFIQALEAALNRGVDIYIGYGYEDINGSHKPSPRGREALNRLTALASSSWARTSGKLHVERIPNHEKILVKDAEFVICGSNNWLSNAQFNNSERSYRIERSDAAKAERDRVVRLITRRITGCAGIESVAI